MAYVENPETFPEHTVVDREDWMEISDVNYDMELLESTVFDSTLDTNFEKLKKNPSQRLSLQFDIDWKNSFFNEEPIICPFAWNQGGEEVYLIASFGAEPRKFKMYKTGNNFYVILDIQRGIYPYRFIVDSQECFSEDHPNFTTKSGLVVNIIDIRYYVPMEYTVKQDRRLASSITYGQKMPKESYFSLYPPPLPELFNYSPIGEALGCISNDIHVYGNNLCQDNKSAKLLATRYICYGMIIRENQEIESEINRPQIYTEYLYITVSPECKGKGLEGDEDVLLWKELSLKGKALKKQ